MATVVVIDDETMNADALAFMLEAEGLAALEIPASQGQDPAQSLAPDSTS